jgi:hypothetical protein
MTTETSKMEITASNRKGKGQGKVSDASADKRFAKNRTGPTGQGGVTDPEFDKRLAKNRNGPTGQGKVCNPDKDRRLAANRPKSSGQGQVMHPESDRRLRANRASRKGRTIEIGSPRAEEESSSIRRPPVRRSEEIAGRAGLPEPIDKLERELIRLFRSAASFRGANEASAEFNEAAIKYMRGPSA